eukprot:TRINITY_DN1881_c0_g2_i1.p1 TRINITY_DN1881_c0_g2~~TRINITY_DN1881_c0_g2_i1.p1  ORF type:complete len:269 (+),score=18.88 TRINITY_DN1881_c0_g2_i1:155-961(+)
MSVSDPIFNPDEREALRSALAERYAAEISVAQKRHARERARDPLTRLNLTRTTSPTAAERTAERLHAHRPRRGSPSKASSPAKNEASTVRRAPDPQVLERLYDRSVVARQKRRAEFAEREEFNLAHNRFDAHPPAPGPAPPFVTRLHDQFADRRAGARQRLETKHWPKWDELSAPRRLPASEVAQARERLTNTARKEAAVTALRVQLYPPPRTLPPVDGGPNGRLVQHLYLDGLTQFRRRRDAAWYDEHYAFQPCPPTRTRRPVSVGT